MAGTGRNSHSVKSIIKLPIIPPTAPVWKTIRDTRPHIRHETAVKNKQLQSRRQPKTGQIDQTRPGLSPKPDQTRKVDAAVDQWTADRPLHTTGRVRTPARAVFFCATHPHQAASAKKGGNRAFGPPFCFLPSPKFPTKTDPR